MPLEESSIIRDWSHFIVIVGQLSPSIDCHFLESRDIVSFVPLLIPSAWHIKDTCWMNSWMAGWIKTSSRKPPLYSQVVGKTLAPLNKQQTKTLHGIPRLYVTELQCKPGVEGYTISSRKEKYCSYSVLGENIIMQMWASSWWNSLKKGVVHTCASSFTEVSGAER